MKDENDLLIAKVLDKKKICNSKNKITYTDFLNEKEQRVIEKNVKLENAFFYGVNENADRKILVFYPEKLTEELVRKSLKSVLSGIRIILKNDQIGNYEHKNYSTEEYIAVCARDHTFKEKFPETMQELVKERLLVREPGSGTRNILEELLLARGMGIKDFLHYTEVENMHTIIGLLKRDCGISFMYKIAVADELKNGTLKEIRLSDFKMQHDFDFIWEKGSIYTEKYIGICEELLKKY